MANIPTAVKPALNIAFDSVLRSAGCSSQALGIDWGNLLDQNTTQVLSVPVLNAITTAATGGLLVKSTAYFYRISAINAVGETLACDEVSITTGSANPSTHIVTLTWNAVPGATGYNVYGRTTGAETLMEAVSGSTLTCIDAGAGLVGTALPVTNSTASVELAGKLNFRGSEFTDDSGTAGDRTVNKVSGRSKIAAGQTAITITNDRCRVDSLVFAVLQTADATGYVKSVVPSAGSFLITCNVCAGDTIVGWVIVN